MNDPKNRASDGAESPDLLYDPDADLPLALGDGTDDVLGDGIDDDMEGDAVVDTFADGQAPRAAAWRRLDERRDDKWLREQLSDWDDWDEDDSH